MKKSSAFSSALSDLLAFPHAQRRLSRAGLAEGSARHGQRVSHPGHRRAKILRRRPSGRGRALDQIDRRSDPLRHRQRGFDQALYLEVSRLTDGEVLRQSYGYVTETFVREPFVPESTMQAMVQRMVQVNMIDAKSAQNTPTSAYFDNSYVAELKRAASSTIFGSKFSIRLTPNRSFT